MEVPLHGQEVMFNESICVILLLIQIGKAHLFSAIMLIRKVLITNNRRHPWSVPVRC